MKYIKFLIAALLVGGFTTACSDWDDHFDETAPTTTAAVQVYDGDINAFLSSQPDYSTLRDAFASAGLTALLSGSNNCTVVLMPNGAIQGSVSEAAAKNLVSDVVFAPSSLIPGNGIYMLSGKNLWITQSGQTFALNEQNVTEIIKASNGYIYLVDGFISVEPSVYEYIQSLGDDYSLFKQLIAEFEETYFDAASSTPAGVDEMGNTFYSDSVIATRNTLMDRYTQGGLPLWNMRSEAYQSTVFIPNDDLVKKAYYNALDSIPVWLNRAPTAQDSLKFRRWIVASCFKDARLSAAEVAATAAGQFECVGGYVREVDETTDTEKFTAIDPAQWKPSVQTVDANAGVTLSNGVAYFLTDYKIPNHIAIHRVKSRFYVIWAALNAQQQGWDPAAGQPTNGGYFRWNNWKTPLVVNDAQGSFELSATLPTMYYHVLTAEPSLEAMTDSLPVSVEYDGLLYNTEDKAYGLAEVSLPAGEYYLRMGFKHSLRYSISIYFGDGDETLDADNLLVENMSLIATGSNFHFDRGGAMEGLDFYGSEGIGYPEYFDWRWWYDQDPVQYQKASAYDTDGYQVAVVTLKKPGNFKIKIESNDNAELYRGVYGLESAARTKNNVQQLMMYHWCLRPTINNY